MFTALITVDLHIPASTSLKGKRGIVKSLIATLRNEVNCSVAEIDHNDLWQRCALGVAVVSGTHGGALKVAQHVEKIVYREPRVDVIQVHVQVVSPEL